MAHATGEHLSSGRRRRIVTVVAVAVLAGLLSAAAPGRATEPTGYTLTEEYITSADGVRVHAFVYRPDHVDGPAPVVITVTPYANTGSNLVSHASNPTSTEKNPITGDPQPAPTALGEALLDQGYVWAVVSLRGYGGSGGCGDWGGKGEQADVAAAIEWAASRDWSNGRVAMVGHSYVGMTGLMGLATGHPALKAVITTAPQAGYHNLWTNGVANFISAHMYPALFVASDLYTPSARSPIDQHRNSLSGTATNPGCQADTMEASVNGDERSPYWQERDLPAKLAGTTVPTMTLQGFNDYQVRPDAVTRIWEGLAGPRRLLLGPWDHSPPLNGARWLDEQVAWIDAFVKDDGRHAPRTPEVRVQATDGTWRAERSWPPAHAATRDISLLPGAYVDVAGNHGETGPPDIWPVAPPMPNGRGSWTFTPPLERPLHLSGVPHLSVEVRAALPDVNLIALVYDVDPEGNAQFITRGAALAGGIDGGFDLYPVDWSIPAGHRIGVLLSGSDDGWFVPSNTGSTVEIRAGKLSVPAVRAPGRVLADGPFNIREQHQPFAIDPAVIEERTTS